MPLLFTHNEEPTAATDHGGLNFVLTTLSPTPGKDEDHVFVHTHGARVQH